MTNFDRVGVMGSSWIWGRATMSTATPPGGGSSNPAPPVFSPPADLGRGSCGGSNALDAPSLPRTAPVVRHRGDVLDAQNLQPRGRQRADGGLPSGTGALHEHVDLGQAMLLGPPGRGLRGQLGCERCG